MESSLYFFILLEHKSQGNGFFPFSIVFRGHRLRSAASLLECIFFNKDFKKICFICTIYSFLFRSLRGMITFGMWKCSPGSWTFTGLLTNFFCSLNKVCSYYGVHTKFRCSRSETKIWNQRRTKLIKKYLEVS